MEERPVHLTVTLAKGTVLMPAWAVILFAVLFVLSSVGLILVVAVENRMMGEVRVIQLYQEDIENVLIRSGQAHRSDFAPPLARGVNGR